MSCNSFDLKGYVLGELAAREKARTEEHLQQCAQCQGELEELKYVTELVGRLPSVPVPQRFVFVRDPIFERPWWQRVWKSQAPLVAASVVLAAAIFAHGWLTRSPSSAATASQIAQLREELRAELRQELQTQQVALLEDMNNRIQQIQVNMEQHVRNELTATHRRDLQVIEEALEYLRRQVGYLYVASMRAGDRQ